MAIYSGFTHWKWWFSIVMLVYQRVVLARVSSGYSLISPVPWPPVASFPWRVPGRRSTGFWWHPTIHLVSCGAVFGQYETTEITWVCVKINEHHLQMSKKSFHLLVNHHSPYIFMSSNGVFLISWLFLKAIFKECSVAGLSPGDQHPTWIHHALRFLRRSSCRRTSWWRRQVDNHRWPINISAEFWLFRALLDENVLRLFRLFRHENYNLSYFTWFYLIAILIILVLGCKQKGPKNSKHFFGPS